MATYNGEVVSGKGISLEIKDGDTAYNTIVRTSAKLLVRNGGYIESTTVYNSATCSNAGIASNTFLSGGTMILQNGGSADVVSVLRNARLTVVEGGIATGLYVSSGNVNATVRGGDGITRIEGTNELGDFYLYDGVAANFLFHSLGLLTVMNGGTALNTTLRDHASLTVSSGGSAVDIKQSANANVTVTVYGGDTKTLVSGTNTEGDFRLSGGVASNFILYDGGAQNVSSGGIALHTLVNGQRAFHNIWSGGTASATSVYRNGIMEIYESGFAKDTMIYSGGSMVTCDGARVAGAIVSGTLLVESAATGEEESGGSAMISDIIITSGGSMKVVRGADFGGVITLAGNVTLGSTMTMADGASLVFDVTGRAGGSDAIIDNWTKVGAAAGASYSLSVSVGETPAIGLYKLAGKAKTFDGTITVNSGATELGTLDKDGSFTSDLLRYSLAVGVDDASALLLTIESIPPQIGYFAGDGARWDPGADGYVAELSTDGFENAIRFAVSQPGIDFYNPAGGKYGLKVRSDVGVTYSDVAEATFDAAETGAVKFVSDEDGIADAFFAQSDEVWHSGYYACHVGTAGWNNGTGEMLSLQGKNRIANVFRGSTDASILFLSDSGNGDALELDDIFTALPDDESDPVARFSQIGEVRAGAGDDILDLTSTKFSADAMTLRGGDGDDVIWSADGDNLLFGDAGNDRLVGGADDDVLCGGIGNDRMHGGGGDDLFTFAGNWGKDTVQQTADGSVTLWFGDLAEGDISISYSMGNTVISNGENSVTVANREIAEIDLRFGATGYEDLYAELAAQGAFADYSSTKIFEKQDSIAVIASLA